MWALFWKDKGTWRDQQRQNDSFRKLRQAGREVQVVGGNVKGLRDEVHTQDRDEIHAARRFYKGNDFSEK